MTSKRVLIVGGGINGLTVADRLSEQGVAVTLVERGTIGGLARSYYYDDGFVFDVGPHRLVTGDERVIRYMQEVCGGELLRFPNICGVYLLGKYYDWPLKLGVILKLPVGIMLRALVDMIRLAFAGKRPTPQSYQEYVLMKYGKTLHDLDFRPYTEKFTKTTVDRVDADWAKMGINRAVANEAIKMDSLFSVVIDTLKPKKPSTAYYPERGIAQFSSLLVERIRQRGGEILQGVTVEELRVEQGRVTGARVTGEAEARPFDHVVWSGSIDDCIRLLLGEPGRLEYIHMVLYNIEVAGKPLNDYQYTYFVDENIPFNRVYSNTLFSGKVAPAGAFGLCVETTAVKDSPAFLQPESQTEAILAALIRAGQIPDRESVLAVHIEHLEGAYPLYTVGYRKLLSDYVGRIEAAAHNLTLSGRSGLFWYNNMDHTIANAEQVAADILAGRRSPSTIAVE
jgi:protoporphyrinogen oxidase